MGLEQRKTKLSGVRSDENQKKRGSIAGKQRKVKLARRKNKKCGVRAEENQESGVKAEINQEKRS